MYVDFWARVRVELSWYCMQCMHVLHVCMYSLKKPPLLSPPPPPPRAPLGLLEKAVSINVRHNQTINQSS